MPIQIPDDSISVGYKEVRPFHYEQVFQSSKAAFTGTEREFVAAGHGYEYVQLDEHTRRTPAFTEGDDDMPANLFDSARFAIAKAKGETP